MTDAVAALVRERGGDIALADVVLPSPGDAEVLVRVVASGVCATDLFGIDGGAGDRYPAVFGHEGAGVVVATGADVRGLEAGDHVVLGFGSCGSCRACADGHPARCARFAELNYAAVRGAVTSDGHAVTTGWMAQSSWATHVVVPASSVVRIADDVPWTVAATLGCGVLTGAGAVINVLRPGPDDALVVIGAGTTGLAAVMAARHRGVARIAVVDPLADRRALATELGAHLAIEPGVGGLPRATHVLDTVGTQGAMDAALSALAPGGTAVTVALRPGANAVSVSQSHLLWGRSLAGVIEGDADIARDVPALAALWRAGRLPVERLVTAFPFAEAHVAVAAARSGRVVKPVLVMADAPPTVVHPHAHERTLLEALRAGGIPDDDVSALWRTLPAVRPRELRGLWRGQGVTRDHRVGALLARSAWFGKLFRSDDDVAPLVCERDGTLVADARLARGGASLRTVEHDGILTAAMVYDGQPIVDAFVRLGPDAVLGVMTGRHADDGGRLFHFVLERVADREVEPAG